MTSRERMLVAITGGQPDHVPLYFRMFGFCPPPALAWSNQVERAERLLAQGVDDMLDLEIFASFHPQVEVRAWKEVRPEERYPLLIKEYHTPAGTLRQEVYFTEDGTSPWPYPRDEPGLMDDYNVPRSRKFPVESEADLELLAYLLQPPNREALAAFRERAESLRAAAERLGLIIVGWGPLGGDAAAWLCGVENLIFLAMDQPEVFDRLLELIQEHDKRLTEILLDSPVDLILRRGWYEHGGFWSPQLFERHFAPRLREVTAMTHQAGKLIGYAMSTGIMPLLEVLTGIGYDLHFFVDPVQGGADLRRVKATLGRRTALLGGMNSPITLERGSAEEIRRAVHEAVEILAPGGGFILSPVDSLGPWVTWESVATVIQAWREVRDCY